MSVVAIAELRFFSQWTVKHAAFLNQYISSRSLSPLTRQPPIVGHFQSAGYINRWSPSRFQLCAAHIIYGRPTWN